MITVKTITDRSQWNTALSTLPFAHVLQTWEWGEFKRATTGWQPQRLAFERGGQIVAMASVGVRSIGPLKVMYISKGPALDYSDTLLVAEVFDHLQTLARRQRAIWLKIDPDVIAATGIPSGDDENPDTPNATGQAVLQTLNTRGWRFSADQIQFRNTVTIDVSRTEDELLAAMSQNTRRKVRTAEKKGVSVRAGTVADLPVLYDLYRTTGERDHFLIRPPEYYKLAWQTFIEAGLAQPLIAEVEGKAIAHVILFRFAKTCWYIYGASSNEERDRMPNYLLQWEAMRWAKAHGCTTYDMWGAPNEFNESDSMWGVYEFKRGFRGTVTRTIGAWDYAPYPLLYAGYTQLWPKVLGLMKRRAVSE
ncbi:MAG: peptidoglycan bridge formation glycyltransferase FemA/FemB family protein [Chloroflexi bacterium]|nr:peptidoglycan bridge formation glycyltransferase FemA/FemB family protein [Chloroflexota bacterium]MCC6896712.1 peptidoglycan bridge formation glycyltransferase FemA/FemB family protein [Anaerolineae bacterium]